MSLSKKLDDIVDPDIILNPVLDRAESAQNYADSVQLLANTAIQQLSDAGTASFGQDLFVNISDTLFDIDSAGIEGLNVVEPVRPDITIPVVTEPSTVIPALPEMEDTDIEVIGNVPVFDVAKPSIYIPELPEDDFPVFTDDAPTTSEVNLPNKPSYVLPALPTIDDVSIPSPPDYNIASFEGDMPVVDLTAPETMFVYNEAQYSSEVADKLAANLLYDLTNGGTGLNTETEQAIWDRATARQDVENEKAYTEAMEFHSSRGFTLPEGVLNANLIEVNNRINQRKDDLNNDILINQSKLAQENTQFAISQAIGMEQNLMSNSNLVQNRAFEVAKATVELANDVYRIKIEQFAARLEGYRVQAQVYETKIRAEISKAEFYKAQIEGIKAGTEVKSLLIAAYNSQIEGIKSLIQMYGVEMEAAKVQADIDRIKLDAYKTKAQVFGIKTDAMTSKYNAYQARIAGESEKVKMYLAETQAFTARVDGFKATSDVVLTKSKIRLAEHQGDVESFKAAVDMYQAESARIISNAETKIKAEGLKIENYKADTEKYRTDIDALIKNYLGKVEAATAEANVLIKEREVALQKLLGEKGLTVEAMLGQSRVAGQLAAAAMTSISASTSLGLSQSQGTSKGTSRSESYSNSDSESHNHNYNH